MFEWILLVVATLAGGVVLARPAWVGYARGFSGSTLLGFVLLSVGMTSPLLFRLHQMMLDSGAGPDAFIGVWNLWWTKQALLHGMNPFFTSWLYYPSGTSLALHTHAVTYGVATLPLQIVFGSEGGTKLYGIYNLILLASFSLTGYFTYRLALHESQHRGASILAGLIMAFCAFRFANTVRLHVIATELLVLTTWAAVVWVHRPNAMRLLGLLGAGFLLAHASLEYTVIALLVFGWITLSRIFPSRLRPAPLPSPGSSEGRRAILRAAYHEDKPPSPRARRFAWVGIAVLALAAWPLGSAVVRRVAAGGTGFDPRLGLYFSADLLDLFLPNPRHPWWGATFSQITGGLHLGDNGFGTHLGLVALVLFVATFRFSWRAHQGRRWALGAFAFAILALGPRLHVNGEVLPVPLPQAIVSHLPILGGTRTPIRYLAAAQLFLAMAVAMGWAGWQRSGRRGAIARDPEAALTVPSLLLTRGELLIGAAILLTCLSAPLRFTAEPIPRVYETIRQRSAGETATLLHVPGMLAREDLLYQTVHRQRLVDDVSSAMPLHTGSEDALRTQAWETFALGFAQPGFVKNLTEDQRGALQQMAREYFGQFGIRWVVVPSDPAHQMAGSADRLPHNMVGPTAYQAYRENFKLLEPVWEQEKDGVTVFEF